MSNDPFDDPFFKNHRDQFNKRAAKTAGVFGAGFLGCGALSIVLNLAFWGGLICFACWALQHWHVFH